MSITTHCIPFDPDCSICNAPVDFGEEDPTLVDSTPPKSPRESLLELHPTVGRIFKSLWYEIVGPTWLSPYRQTWTVASSLLYADTQPGDEVVHGWPRCVNPDCVAFGEANASASFRAPETFKGGAEGGWNPLVWLRTVVEFAEERGELTVTVGVHLLRSVLEASSPPPADAEVGKLLDRLNRATSRVAQWRYEVGMEPLGQLQDEKRAARSRIEALFAEKKANISDLEAREKYLVKCTAHLQSSLAEKEAQVLAVSELAELCSATGGGIGSGTISADLRAKLVQQWNEQNRRSLSNKEADK